jgi:ketosteroid isomerase-like protein
MSAIDEVAARIVALETAALERWCAGDPSGFLALSDEDVVYFDPFLDRRLDGLAALTAYYEKLRGKISAARFELLNPKVRRAGDMAVLTFNFVSWDEDESALRWHCTEVYVRRGDAWKIVQTHWSFASGRRS